MSNTTTSTTTTSSATEPPHSTSNKNQFTVKVVAQSGEDVIFKVTPTTKLSKLMDAYLKRSGLEKTSVKFMVDGQRVNDQHSIEEAGIQDGDQIDVVIEQVGGSH